MKATLYFRLPAAARRSVTIIEIVIVTARTSTMTPNEIQLEIG